jgi:hypothetical protein
MQPKKRHWICMHAWPVKGKTSRHFRNYDILMGNTYFMENKEENP